MGLPVGGGWSQKDGTKMKQNFSWNTILIFELCEDVTYSSYVIHRSNWKMRGED